MRRRRALAAGLGLGLVGLGAQGCAGAGGSQPLEWADRRDYQAFRRAHPELLEPNYLPFMAHRFSGVEPGADLLVLCRWDPAAMPLDVFIATPAIPEALQDEFSPRDPARYVAAAEAALGMWERELEGLVAFRRAVRRDGARLEIELVPARGPADPERQALGSVHLRSACRLGRREAAGRRFEVRYAVPRLRVYLADGFGLLTPDQVQWSTLHEIGHALGMRGHSPIPADLMYAGFRDRVIVPELSTGDVNSFVSLYRLPSGAVYARVAAGQGARRAPPAPPAGPPALALAPHVDPRLGFSLRPPEGWTRIDTGRGVVVVDGVTWDYAASFQVVVSRHATLEDYLARYAASYLSHGRLERLAPLRVRGRRALHATLHGTRTGMTEELTFIESGDGRVIALIADCPTEHHAAYRPWFRAAMSSLEIWDLDPGGR